MTDYKSLTIKTIDNLLRDNRSSEAFDIYQSSFRLCSSGCGDCGGDWRVLCCREKTSKDIRTKMEDALQSLKEVNLWIETRRKLGGHLSNELNTLYEITKHASTVADKAVEEIEEKREYYCEYQSNCKGEPLKRNEVWYDRKEGVAVCKKCWGGREPPSFAQ